MKPFKAKFTANILKLINILPYIFTRRFRAMSKRYIDSETKNSVQKEEDKIKFCSFLEGNFLWKAVAITVQLDRLELKSLHRWVGKNSSLSACNPGRGSDSFTVNYHRGDGCRVLGWISINTEKTTTTLASIQHNSENCSSCFITLDTLSRGLSYVTIYIMLTEKANQKVKDVNVDLIEKYKSFQSINPLSEEFMMINNYRRFDLINKLITKNFNKVVSDCKDISLSILKMWNIKKSTTELIAIADFYRDCSDPYFYPRDKKAYIKKNLGDCQALVLRIHSIVDMNISNDRNENYFENSLRGDLDIHSCYILSKPESEFKAYNNYKKIGLTTDSSHLLFSLIKDLYRQYHKISDDINPTLIKNRNVAEKNHKILHDTLLDTDQLKGNICSVENHLTSDCDEKYHATAKIDLRYIKKITTRLANSIKQRKEHSRDALELRNICFHKKYSFFVGLLVAVQVALAVLIIDWEKKSEEIVSYYENITNQSRQPAGVD